MTYIDTKFHIFGFNVFLWCNEVKRWLHISHGLSVTLYFTKCYFNKIVICVGKFLPHAFRDPTVSGTAAALSEVRSSAILLLLVLGNLRTKNRGSIQWYNDRTNFHENRSLF
jgi:hypothetical protein